LQFFYSQSTAALIQVRQRRPPATVLRRCWKAMMTLLAFSRSELAAVVSANLREFALNRIDSR
jgi:hypothetical protein